MSWKKPETFDMCGVLIMVSVYGYLCFVDEVTEEVKKIRENRSVTDLFYFCYLFPEQSIRPQLVDNYYGHEYQCSSQHDAQGHMA